MRAALVALVLLIIGAPAAAADDGGTPADQLILAARNEVAIFTTALTGTTGVTPELQTQAGPTLTALREARTITTRYPCPSGVQECTTALGAAHDATGMVIDDVEALTGSDPGPWDALVAQYTENAAAFDSAWDDFRVAYGAALSDESGLSATVAWLLVAAAVVVSLALTIALSLWARRARPADDRVVTARRALVSASTLLTFVIIGATLTVLVIDGFDAAPTGRAGGKAALVLLLVPVAVLNLLWATIRFFVARKKAGVISYGDQREFTR